MILIPLVLGWACTKPETEPTAIHLVDRFDEATVDNPVAAKSDLPRIEWTFADEEASPTWETVGGLQDVTVRDGKLSGRVVGPATLVLPGPESPDPNDFFHAIEIVLQASEGTRLGVGY